MGHEENKIIYDLYLCDQQLGVREIAVSEDALTPEAMSLFQPEFTMEIKMPPGWRCNSRKRFVKLLMGEGCSRNMANELAAYVQAMRGRVSYQDVLFEALGLIHVAQANLGTRKEREQ